ncbi:MAG: glycosyltransferase family 2 protein [Planctomycetota bacterium]|jgi:dolichol-phosphate mannosyltransferase
MNCVDCLVAIPVFNEEQYLTGVLEDVRRYADEILVVDDGSTDATPDLLSAETGLHVITHPENRGYGKSLADAFCFARRGNYKWLITIDCDEQHDAAWIPDFLERIAADQADIISGTRYPEGRQVGTHVPQDRRSINVAITGLINTRLQMKITDAFCGFKAYRVSELKHIEITVPGYAMPMQFWVQAARAGLRVEELPVPLIYDDPNRHFGGMLDDPAVRLAHYLEVFRQEVEAGAARTGSSSDDCVSWT